MQIKITNKEEWRKIIEEQASSGLSIVSFCKQKGIKAEKFYYHADTLKESKHKKIKDNPDFLPVEVTPLFQNKECINQLSIRIILKNGIECILPEGITGDYIKEVVEVLQKC